MSRVDKAFPSERQRRLSRFKTDLKSKQACSYFSKNASKVSKFQTYNSHTDYDLSVVKEIFRVLTNNYRSTIFLSKKPAKNRTFLSR